MSSSVRYRKIATLVAWKLQQPHEKKASPPPLPPAKKSTFCGGPSGNNRAVTDLGTSNRYRFPPVNGLGGAPGKGAWAGHLGKKGHLILTGVLQHTTTWA